MFLSILICHIPERAQKLGNLLDAIHKQADSLGYDNGREYEIITNKRMDLNIGAKRNALLKAAKGKFIVFIDDDDMILPGYMELIIDKIKNNPDADHIGISGYITTNGKDKRQWHISSEYGAWFEQDGIYYRTPNHISPVLREIALNNLFPEVNYGEDYEYSMGILPFLKSQVKIEGNIYHYDYRP